MMQGCAPCPGRATPGLPGGAKSRDPGATSGARLGAFAFSSEAWWVAGSLLSFLALAAVAFSHYRHTLFYRFDGSFILTHAVSQPRWAAPGFGLSANFLEGIGDLWFPIATRWDPGFFFGGLFDQRVMPVIASLIFALEFFLSTFVLARSIGAGIVTALAGAWLGALFTLPFFIPTLADWRLWGNPHFMTAVAVASLSLAAFQRIGRGNLPTDIGAASLTLVLLGYLVISDPVLMPIAASALAVFGGAAIVMADSRHERLGKIIAAAIIVAISALAFGPYEVALFTYARTTYFWEDLAAFPVSWREHSFLISEGRGYGLLIWAACVAGAALAAARGPWPMKRAAIAFLCFIGLEQLIFLLNLFVGFSWRGPSAGYLDMFALPLYALFGGYLVIGWWCETPKGRGRAIAFMSVVPWAPVLLSLHDPFAKPGFRNENPFVWPPQETAITKFLQAEIGLREGEPFRGRVANIAGAEFEPQYATIPLVSQHSYDGAVAFYTGNDHRYFGLWYYDIPTLIQDNQFSSPFAHATVSRLFSRRDEKHVRQLTTITRFDPRLYALLGVHFVMTSRPLAGFNPALTVVVNSEAPQAWTLYLYELPGASVAGYWSTRPMQSSTVRQAMRWMVSGASEADAAIYEPVPQLVPGSFKEIRVFRDRLVVVGESTGTSLLVLPIEFSHCLDVSIATGSGARVLRANINQTALLFSGRTEVELRYRFSPWHFRCRFRDIADARRLDLANVGWPE
jgi:hypothetical protein